MNADANLDVWLETIARTQPSVVIPYVKTQRDAVLHYRVQTARQGVSGKSATTQSGTMRVSANVATELTRFSFSHSSDDYCQITVAIQQAGKPPHEYAFECPAAESP